MAKSAHTTETLREMAAALGLTVGVEVPRVATAVQLVRRVQEVVSGSAE